MKTTKMVQILSGVAMLLTGLLIFVALLFFALLPEGSFDLFGRTWRDVWVSDSVLLWMFTTVFPISFVEGGLFWIRESRAMGSVAGDYPRSNGWSQVGRAQAILDLVGGVCAVFFLLALIGLALVALLSLVVSAPVSLPGSALGLVAASVLYLIVRFPAALIWREVSGQVGTLARKGLATYRLVDGGVEIDLGTRKGRSREPARVRLRFDELEEIRRFTFVEAQTFLKYTVGPNVELFARQTQDLYRYYRGEIPRPRVYTLTAANSVGTNVLLRGGDLFYLLSFEADDVSDLIEAFETHKKGRLSG